MATTCRDIIHAALRKLGILRPGAAASNGEASDALFSLQSLYLEWIEGGMFGPLTDVTATAAYEAKEGERVASAGFTVTLPTTLIDVTSGESRSPVDLAVVVVVTAGAAQATSIYDANRGEWVSIAALDLADNAPLAGRGADGLAACLAKRLSDDYGEQVTAQTEQAAGLFLRAITMKRTSRAVETSYF
jgi:hypothetical protein